MHLTRLAKLLMGILLLSSAITAFDARAQDAVKIGVLTDLSGGYAEITGKSAIQAAQMAIDDFGGKVIGKPIGLVAADHQNKADVGLAVAREWVDVQGVTAILDVNNSAVGLAVNELVRSRKRIFLAGATSAELIGAACSPDTTTQWIASSGGLARAVALPAARSGLQDWFFLTVDYAFGHALESQAKTAVASVGARIVGSSHFAATTSDFSSYLLDAQSRGAKTLAVAAAGTEMTNIVKQVREFGLQVSIVPFFLAETDVDAVGLDTLAGVRSATQYYWDRNDESRAFAARFKERSGRLPTFSGEQQYSAVTHYLKAVASAGTTDAASVSAKMREIPVADASGFRAIVREDGRVMNDMFAFIVKPRSGSKGIWDYFQIMADVKADELYPSLKDSACPLLGSVTK